MGLFLLEETLICYSERQIRPIKGQVQIKARFLCEEKNEFLAQEEVICLYNSDLKPIAFSELNQLAKQAMIQGS